MISKIILDTNYIVGLIDEEDVHHRNALQIEKKLIAADIQFIYLDCVINEVINVVVRRFRERKRTNEIAAFIGKLQTLCTKENITWMYPEIERFYNSIVDSVKKNNGELNFHDLFIVHIATELEIQSIVSFDKGFDKTRLKRIKDAAEI